MIRKLRVISCLFFLIILSFTTSVAEEIKIGVILPITGPMAPVGVACRDAILMAVEDARSQNKFDYKIIFEDDRLIPGEVAKAAQKLIHMDKVSAIISTWSYGGQIVSPMATKAGIPHIGVAWDYRVADGDFNFLHLTPPSEFMEKFLEAFKKLGKRRIALLGVEESGSVFALDEFIRMAKNYDIEVVFRDSVLFDITDFNSVVSRIIRKKPDYLLFNMGGEGMISSLIQSLKRQRAEFPFTAVTALDVIQNLSLAEGVWYVSDSYLPDEFAERFKKKYGHGMRYGIGNYYEGLQLIMSAYEKVGAVDPEKAKAELLKIKDQPSIFGPTSVDEQGIFTYPARFMRIQDGKRELVELEDIGK